MATPETKNKLFCKCLESIQLHGPLFYPFLPLSWVYGISCFWFICRIKSKQKAEGIHFENAHSEITPGEGLQPITVSSMDYPSKILPVNPVEDQPVQASLYEETGMDEGLSLELFSWKNSPVLAEIIDDYHHQQ